MTLPLDLVLIRHGESEGNLANDLAKKGDNSAYSQEFRQRPSSQWRLTKKGVEQAQKTGYWIKRFLTDWDFDFFYVSDYVRAWETAFLLEIDIAKWQIEMLLRARDLGGMDVMPKSEIEEQYKKEIVQKKLQPFYFRPPHGESMADLCQRIEVFIGILHRECANKKVIVICHGEVMGAFRVCLEKIISEKWVSMPKTIQNCQIFHYSRSDKSDGNDFEKLKIITPDIDGLIEGSWQEIRNLLFSNRELLHKVNKVPKILEKF